VVFANAYVGPNTKIGSFCVLNTATSIDHDCSIGDQNFLAPGTILAGSVTTGEKCFFGMGSLVTNDISVGPSSIVAANSFVNDNIPSNSFVAGIPAKLKSL
jgi:UDP-3-O-[3-hydroxymyristoyl] glucosamine N-acyltransferase